ncbi:hypothetical protein CC80DRAFT_496196 [Byssothecium circinans]|uniref:Uncharacterized protein n=1 Tax=Byssothecium circinans TaxID=147558 RepID=A0A6A5TG35_9PLEO|nr:hypothetical protein CC80DRAFT_496196 [Byssothecium circinans]
MATQAYTHILPLIPVDWHPTLPHPPSAYAPSTFHNQSNRVTSQPTSSLENFQTTTVMSVADHLWAVLKGESPAWIPLTYGLGYMIVGGYILNCLLLANGEKRNKNQGNLMKKSESGCSGSKGT